MSDLLEKDRDWWRSAAQQLGFEAHYMRAALRACIDWRDNITIKGDGRLDDSTEREWREVVLPLVEKAGVEQ